ncbi:putative inositol monophosphatase, ecdysteroid kinase, protein kinase-like domain superfamily [Plasmopara halstedii]
MTTTSSPKLRTLLSACFSASVHGGRVIREVVQQHIALDLVNKQEGAYDPQTVADRRSQQRIIYALRQAFPNVTIVGEEGELAPPALEDAVQCDLQALESIAFNSDCSLDWDDLVLWVDPLDGTKRFAAKVYEEVSVLIGITYKMRPIAGVVHLPFHGRYGITYWGGPNVGVYRTEHGKTDAQVTHIPMSSPLATRPHRPLICTVSSTACDQVDNVVQLLNPSTVLTGGATGTMVLGVIIGHSDVFFRLKAATRKWDICAVEPLIEALGGKLTDTHGHVYVYDHIKNAPEYDNERGLVAALTCDTHEHVLNVLAKVTLTRALDGQMMTPKWFQEYVFPGHQVSKVHVVSNSIHFGPHSSVVKLKVQFIDPNRSVTIFLKKSARNELPARSVAQWKRDLASYRTETNFYAHFVPLLLAHGVPLIRPLAVFQSDRVGHCTQSLVATVANEEQKCTDPESFMLLLECLGTESTVPSSPSVHYEAADCLELDDTRQALKYLAHLHASAWGQDEFLAKIRTALWPHACWWTLPKRGEMELAQCIDVWARMLNSWQQVFRTDATLSATNALSTIGERMIQHAVYISSNLHDASLTTLVHGDFKSANLFFESQSRQVIAFDWQWTGLGLGVLDVANLLNTSVSISLLDTDDKEREVLQFYYESLHEKLGTTHFHLREKYPFPAFERHYMLATLEYARILISKFWKDLTPQKCEAMAHKTNCGLGYRSIPHVVRMVRKLHQGLERISQERQEN